MKSVLSEHCGCTFLRLGSFGNPLSDASSLLVIDNVWRLTNSSVMPDICVAWQLSTFNSSTCQQQPREHSWHVYLYYSHGNLPGCRAIPNWLTHFLSCWSKNSRRLSWTKWSVTNQDYTKQTITHLSILLQCVFSERNSLGFFYYFSPLVHKFERIVPQLCHCTTSVNMLHLTGPVLLWSPFRQDSPGISVTCPMFPILMKLPWTLMYEYSSSDIGQVFTLNSNSQHLPHVTGM